MSDRSITKRIPTAREDVVLEISTSHDKDRKRFISTAIRKTISDGFISFKMFEDTQALVAQDVARFSRKRLEEHHQALLNSLDLPAWKIWAEAKN